LSFVVLSFVFFSCLVLFCLVLCFVVLSISLWGLNGDGGGKGKGKGKGSGKGKDKGNGRGHYGRSRGGGRCNNKGEARHPEPAKANWQPVERLNGTTNINRGRHKGGGASNTSASNPNFFWEQTKSPVLFSKPFFDAMPRRQRREDTASPFWLLPFSETRMQ
jgi:hypothetical protein